MSDTDKDTVVTDEVMAVTNLEAEMREFIQNSTEQTAEMIKLVSKSGSQVDQMIALGQQCIQMLDEARGRSEHSNKVASLALAASVVSCSVSTLFMILVVILHGIV